MVKKTKSDGPVVEENRIVEILKEMESKGHKGDLMWMQGDGVVADIRATSSGVLSLDIALGCGGYPHGRIIEIYGENSAGKSTCTLHAMASVQKHGGIASLIDVEFAYDPTYAQNLGVDVGNVLINQPNSGEEALAMADHLSQVLGHGDIIVVDSVAALVPQRELDGEMTDDSVGLQARLMGKALRKITANVSKSGVILFFTNQLRQVIGGGLYGPKTSTPGGKSLPFYASIRLDIKKGQKIKKGEEVIGHEAKVQVVKNKCAPPYRTAVTEIRFGEGVPRALDILLCGMNCGIVAKRGAWLDFNGECIGQGKDNAWEALKNNPELLAQLEKAVRTHYGI